MMCSNFHCIQVLNLNRVSINSRLTTAITSAVGSLVRISSRYQTHIYHRKTFSANNEQLFRRWSCTVAKHRGTSLIRTRNPLGPYRRPMPRALGGSQGGGRFLMGEVPLYTLQPSPFTLHPSLCILHPTTYTSHPAAPLSLSLSLSLPLSLNPSETSPVLKDWQVEWCALASSWSERSQTTGPHVKRMWHA